MMKNLVVLFAGADMRYALTKDFDGKSAFALALLWARAVAADGGDVVVFTVPAYQNAIADALTCDNARVADGYVVVRDAWTNADIAAEIAAACAAHQADYAVYAWADLPFLSVRLTSELSVMQTRYKAEYSFADGFPYGLAPEVVDKGTAGIIAALGRDSQKAAGERAASRNALFSIMNGDINSFEIETLIADKDYRMMRLSFDCGSKAGALCCQRLYAAAQKAGMLPNTDDESALSALDVYQLSDLAAHDCGVLQTLPAFYDVQLSVRYNHACRYSPAALLCERLTPPSADMPFERFCALVADIAATSERAVVSLSLWGEPLLHPRFVDCVREVLRYPQLSIFIETDGTLVTEELSEQLAEEARALPAATDGAFVCTGVASRVIWCVQLDAVSSPMYAAVHGIANSAQAEADFAAATRAVAVLSRQFPHAVYPQFTRMKQNESELEAFYRSWRRADSPSLGELVIQKYDRFCGVLPDEKSADLSPLERFPCWHLRRDLCVRADGGVPFCKSAFPAAVALNGAPSSCVAGNVFDEGITAVWRHLAAPLQKHIQGDYAAVCSGVCKACDEYYTFNF